jgi:lipopolysaccharide biosynthesis protein
LATRKNFGYDFGGYRDGIWLLSQWKIDLEILLIMNDSIWFPLHNEEKLINQMEASSAQFVGALQLDPSRETKNLPLKKRPFYGSFFLLVKRDAWAHPAFQAFWANYRITSNKYKTIRRGERGLSHAMMDTDLLCEAIYTRNALDNYFRELDSAELKIVLNDLITIDERLEKHQKYCLSQFADTPIWRQQAIELALKMTEKQNVLATAPITSMTVFEVPYLKKSKDLGNMKALAHIRKNIDEGYLTRLHKSIASDISKFTYK